MPTASTPAPARMELEEVATAMAATDRVCKGEAMVAVMEDGEGWCKIFTTIGVPSTLVEVVIAAAEPLPSSTTTSAVTMIRRSAAQFSKRGSCKFAFYKCRNGNDNSNTESLFSILLVIIGILTLGCCVACCGACVWGYQRSRDN